MGFCSPVGRDCCASEGRATGPIRTWAHHSLRSPLNGLPDFSSASSVSETRTLTSVSDSPQPWQDQDPVDPTWSAPAPAAEPRRGPAKLLVIGIPILAVLVIIGAVWGLGGFKPRKDQLIDKDPGTVLATGPFEFTFTKATAQRKRDFDDTHYWEVTAIGQGRTTGDVAIGPSYSGDRGMFVARDPNSHEVQIPEITMYGKGGYTSASQFTPGLPPTAFRVQFKFSDKYKPGKTIRFGASVLEFTDTSLIGDDEKEWNNTVYFYHLHLPVEVLPEDDY